MSTQIVEQPVRLKAPALRPAPNVYPVSWTLVLLISDVLLFIVASCLGAFSGFHHWNSPRIESHLVIADVFYVALWVVVFDRLGLYRRTFALSIKDELYYTVAALIIGTVPQLILFTIYPGISTSRIVLLYALAYSIVLVGSSRAILHRIRQSQWLRSRRRISIVGSAAHIAEVMENLQLGDGSQTQAIVVEGLAQSLGRIDLMRDADLATVEWFDRARAWGCDSLILTEIIPPHVLCHVLEVAARQHISLSFAPRMTRHAYDLSLRTDGRQVLIVPARLRACTPRVQLVKRMMDIALASVALLIFAPVMLLAALAVYLESGGPVLYKQQRIGASGLPFSILKFRSMRHDAEMDGQARWASKNDARTTRVGAILRRFSFDELPQLFNVLRGDMSLVGPRPERPIFVDLFRTSLPRYDERHLVRPGITGWSQVHMKRVLETSAAGEKLHYDLQYIENWSLFLDIAVLFQTLCEFLFHRAA
ncbi:MAG: sugar transferase [Candidatus Eremiobacteraeota bacterium]|nr:sugar transferase [Candidatus Eremiobacteraeota bacterium]MBV9055384.1 sugar transferase [Candidatus Eremiobacteraeota bacterium]